MSREKVLTGRLLLHISYEWSSAETAVPHHSSQRLHTHISSIMTQVPDVHKNMRAAGARLWSGPQHHEIGSVCKTNEAM